MDGEDDDVTPLSTVAVGSRRTSMATNGSGGTLTTHHKNMPPSSTVTINHEAG